MCLNRVLSRTVVRVGDSVRVMGRDRVRVRPLAGIAYGWLLELGVIIYKV